MHATNDHTLQFHNVFRLGEHADHFITSALWYWKQALVILAPCQGALSCMNTYPLVWCSLTNGKKLFWSVLHVLFTVLISRGGCSGKRLADWKAYPNYSRSSSRMLLCKYPFVAPKIVSVWCTSVRTVWVELLLIRFEQRPFLKLGASYISWAHFNTRWNKIRLSGTLHRYYSSFCKSTSRTLIVIALDGSHVGV